MKLIITENKLFDNFQKLIDRELSKLRARYRSEEISASNWYLTIFSKIDSVKVTDIKSRPGLSVYINVYGDSRLDEDDIQTFANYLREKLSVIGDPWIVPKLVGEINEISRTWMDQEHEEMFDKTKDKVVNSIIKKFKSYSEDEKYIEIYGDESGEKVLIRYNIKNKELYYNNSLNRLYQKALPHPMWWVNDKYYIEAAFKKEFPDREVNRVGSANIV